MRLQCLNGAVISAGASTVINPAINVDAGVNPYLRAVIVLSVSWANAKCSAANAGTNGNWLDPEPFCRFGDGQPLAVRIVTSTGHSAGRSTNDTGGEIIFSPFCGLTAALVSILSEGALRSWIS